MTLENSIKNGYCEVFGVFFCCGCHCDMFINRLIKKSRKKEEKWLKNGHCCEKNSFKINVLSKLKINFNKTYTVRICRTFNFLFFWFHQKPCTTRWERTKRGAFTLKKWKAGLFPHGYLGNERKGNEKRREVEKGR